MTAEIQRTPLIRRFVALCHTFFLEAGLPGLQPYGPHGGECYHRWAVITMQGWVEEWVERPPRAGRRVAGPAGRGRGRMAWEAPRDGPAGPWP